MVTQNSIRGTYSKRFNENYKGNNLYTKKNTNCNECHEKGHWRKDPECPLKNKAENGSEKRDRTPPTNEY